MDRDIQHSILYVSRVAFLGGAERILLLSMEQAATHGYLPLLACPPDGRLPELARSAGFEVFPCNFNRMRATSNPVTIAGYVASLYRESKEVERICREQNVTILHPHGPVAAVYSVRAAKSLKIPMLVHLHDAQPPSTHYAMAVRYSAKATTSFVCVANAVLRRVSEMGLPETHATVLYNGVDPAFLQPITGDRKPTMGSGPHIGIMAQIMPWKGQNIFLEAAAILAPEFPTAHFYVIGGLAFPEDQPFLNRLKAIANQVPLAGRVTFTGFQTDMPAWTDAMDVIALCSVEDEAQPMVVLEAMALGKKIVGTDIGGTSEIITDRVTGRLVPPGDAKAMAEAIAESIRLPESDRRGELARKDVQERFTPSIFGLELARVYSETLSGQRPGARIPQEAVA